MARKRYIQAINEALFEEMERDENVILIGEDVELAIFGDARGLYERFGRNRIRNTPICEATLTGMALGATAAGYHVILHMMFANFVYTGFDAIANQISKMRLMTGGQIEIPITFMSKRCVADLATPRMAALSPGQSPPLVRIPNVRSSSSVTPYPCGELGWILKTPWAPAMARSSDARSR